MTVDEKIETLVKVCRRIIDSMGDYPNIIESHLDKAYGLLDSIDARDGEHEREPCKHNGVMIPRFTVPRGSVQVHDVIVCLDCGAIGRISRDTHETQWWPEGGHYA